MGSFDKPVKKKIIDYGLSSLNLPGRHNLRVKLYCFFYPHFVVKEYDDEGLKDAKRLAITLIEKERFPKCERTPALGEKTIDWNGYFRGVKGNLVVFEAADGTDGGMPFFIYDSSTGKGLFEDNAYDSTMGRGKIQDSPFNELKIDIAPGKGPFLRYLRVVEAGCDLRSEKRACWQQVRKKLELKSTEMPACTGYENISDRRESAIAYPVEVSLFPQPAIKTIPGPVKCWPVD